MGPTPEENAKNIVGAVEAIQALQSSMEASERKRVKLGSLVLTLAGAWATWVVTEIRELNQTSAKTSTDIAVIKTQLNHHEQFRELIASQKTEFTARILEMKADFDSRIKLLEQRGNK